jgi:hypothetical protein
MTSEVVLMNRQAIALAADSASTVTYWQKGKRHIRYFKGANKIFHLSFVFPVALMIYDSAELEDVPWETIAKSYRKSIGTKSLDHLGNYGDDLLKFIEDNIDLYPLKSRENNFIYKVKISLDRLIFILNDAVNENKLEVKEIFDEIYKDTQADQFIGNINQDQFYEIIKNYQKDFNEFFKKIPMPIFSNEISSIKLIELAVLMSLKKQTATFSSSCLVITGFGNKDYFPILKRYTCYGFINRKLVYKIEEERTINSNNFSEIIPLAQTTMAETFMNGISKATFIHIGDSANNILDKILRYIGKSGTLSSDEVVINDIKTKFIKEFADELLKEFKRSHIDPMKVVVGILPIAELAELAEMLVRMESLKERVTRNSEEVSGPIDVAVISKGDGFIWIKRKHYFDPNLNPRFFKKRESNAE